MKTKLFTIGAAIFAAVTLTAVAQTNSVQLTPDQVAKLDNSIQSIVPLIPAKFQGTVASAIAVLGLLAMAGRVIVGWKTSGLFGALAGLFGGTNSSKTVINAVTPPSDGYGSPTPAKGASLLKLLLLLALPALLFTGCAGTQVVNASKGTGLDLDLPLGYNGANLFELKMKVGQFLTTTAVQPVGTNKLYSPSVSVASATDGSVTAPSLMAGGTNVANVTGGDKYNVNLGTANSSVSSPAGTATSQTSQ